ncbi:MAG: uroporphyrin-III C-methyltransferase, partial [Thaumarchaeota archaeon S15]
ALVTGHEDPTKGTESVRWEALAGSVDTIVVLMGLGRIRAICERLVAGGLDASTPVAVIQEGTTPRQATARGTLGDIADTVSERGMRAPAIIIVGAAAALDVGARGA